MTEHSIDLLQTEICRLTDIAFPTLSEGVDIKQIQQHG